MNSFLDTYTPIFFIAVGAVIFIYALWEMRRGAASKKWPMSEGLVTSSGVNKSEETDWGNDDDDQYQSPTTSTKYTPKVTYDYEVEGVSFKGDRIAFMVSAYGDHGTALKVVEPYAKGSRVDVYYNPKKPDFAVLEPGGHWFSYFVILFGLVFMAMGAMFANFMPIWLSDT